MSVQLAGKHVTIQFRLYRDRQWFGWGELCRDTRNCIVTEGLIGLGECHDTISVL